MLMKTQVLFFVLACALCAGCGGKSKSGKVIGGADGPTRVMVADKDTVVYELPECDLYYTDSLVPSADTAVAAATEHPVYWENVRFVNLFVTNPTDEPLSFGRSWWLSVWDDGHWGFPEMKVGGVAWEDDLFTVDKAPLRYCFRLPVGEYYLLPKGKYRLSKSFVVKGERQSLYAEFEVK